MKKLRRKFSLVGTICLGALIGVASPTKSVVGPIDLTEGDRGSNGTEELTFSNLWDGGADATVTITQDGTTIFSGLTGEGVKTWAVNRNGGTGGPAEGAFDLATYYGTALPLPVRPGYLFDGWYESPALKGQGSVPVTIE